jgi:hypothetical protein
LLAGSRVILSSEKYLLFPHEFVRGRATPLTARSFLLTPPSAAFRLPFPNDKVQTAISLFLTCRAPTQPHYKTSLIAPICNGNPSSLHHHQTSPGSNSPHNLQLQPISERKCLPTLPTPTSNLPPHLLKQQTILPIPPPAVASPTIE